VTPQQFFTLGLDPSLLLRARQLAVDPWQRELLLGREREVLLNCCRQAGKSTAASALALHEALYSPGALVLLLSPGLRQSRELFRKVLAAYDAVGRPVRARHTTQLQIELAHGARIVSLPGKEATIRGYSPALVVIDEAARVPDDLYRAVRPMLAVTHGRLLALSTPFGQRGWFYRAWHGSGAWKRICIPWTACPRIRPEFIETERHALGNAWVAQEYECLFTAMEGLVYPDFAQALCETTPPAEGRQLGGIDWGWRNPFAAIWGVLDREDVLWLHGERYLRETPLHEHARALPRGIMWYADPSGRTEIEELRVAGHVVRAGANALRAGIAAVTARVRTGRLKVSGRRCPNLVAEAQLYRYAAGGGEEPLDENNHALAAVRYLIASLDQHRQAKPRSGAAPSVVGTPPAPTKPRNDERLWTTL
jgi:hypothetical protein